MEPDGEVWVREKIEGSQGYMQFGPYSKREAAAVVKERRALFLQFNKRISEFM
jgi:hypothetical protein